MYVFLPHYARCDDGCALGVEAVHHGRKEVEFVLDGVGDEVGIDEDGVGGCKRGIVGEEERGGHLWAGKC